MEVITYRFYKHKTKGSIVFVLTNGVIQLPKKEKIIIFGDGNNGKTGMMSVESFLESFEICKEKIHG